MTLEDVDKAVNDVYLLSDPGVVRLLIATVVSNLINKESKPVWLLLIAGSSSGKTALLQMFDGLKDRIFPIDTLTVNTFSSAMERHKPTSLLEIARDGVLVFKDFTTLTSMHKDNLREIMGQLRAIYDGSFNKKTGNGVNVDWVGKLGVIAGGTTAVQRKMREYSDQGERFVNYVMVTPDPKAMTDRALTNLDEIKEKERSLQGVITRFVDYILAKPQVPHDLPPVVRENIISLTDFCTLARSPVTMSFKTGQVEFVPDREMPARMAMMFMSLAKIFIFMEPSNRLTLEDAEIVYKCALDSIPPDRRLILRLLTKFTEASTKDLAIELNYPTDPVRNWCSQLNALKIIDRKGAGKGDVWNLKAEYRPIIAQFDHILMTDIPLQHSDEAEKAFDSNETELAAQKPAEMDWGAFADHE